MLKVFKDNIQLLGLFVLWAVSGILFGPLAYGVVLLSVFIFWRKGMYTALFLGFWVILVYSDSLEYQMAWAKTLKNIYILLLAGILYVDREKFAPFVKLYKLYVPFFVIAIYGLTQSPVLIDGAMRTLSYILIIVITPNFVVKIYRDRGSVFFKEIILVGLAILIMGLAWRYIDHEVAISHGNRFRGIFGNPNGLGLYSMILFLIFSISRAVFPNLFTRNELRFFMAVLLTTVVLTGSRNALVSISLFWLLGYVFKTSMMLGLVFLIGAGVLYEFVSVNIVSIVNYLGLQEYLRIDSLEEGSGRLIAWQFAWLNIQDFFFLGRGFSYDLFLMRSNYDWLSRLGHEGGVHNSYLILWLNTGLIGLLAFFRAFFLLFIRGGKYNRLAVPCLVAVLFSANFEPWLVASLNPYTIGFLVCLTMLTEPVFYNNVQLKDSGEETNEDNPITSEAQLALNEKQA
jgi:O-antigen ligase